jgi:hypothetical protein
MCRGFLHLLERKSLNPQTYDIYLPSTHRSYTHESYAHTASPTAGPLLCRLLWSVVVLDPRLSALSSPFTACLKALVNLSESSTPERNITYQDAASGDTSAPLPPAAVRQAMQVSSLLQLLLHLTKLTRLFVRRARP